LDQISPVPRQIAAQYFVQTLNAGSASFWPFIDFVLMIKYLLFLFGSGKRSFK
jgi:hypothetical protein